MQQTSLKHSTESTMQQASESSLERDKPKSMSKLRLTSVLLAFLLVVVWLFRPETEPVRQEPLPVLASLPEFSLTGQDGNEVTLKDMRGFVWIADFIFTTCAGPCPELTLRMHSLQRSLAGGNKAVKLVSVTTDPNYDTPAVLTRYARRNHADPDMWLFLTGSDEKAMHELIRTGFLQTVIPASHDEPIIHSTYFVLVDAVGRIRAFYDGLDAESKAVILRDVESLLHESQE